MTASWTAAPLRELRFGESTTGIEPKRSFRRSRSRACPSGEAATLAPVAEREEPRGDRSDPGLGGRAQSGPAEHGELGARAGIDKCRGVDDECHADGDGEVPREGLEEVRQS